MNKKDKRAIARPRNTYTRRKTALAGLLVMTSLSAPPLALGAKALEAPKCNSANSLKPRSGANECPASRIAPNLKKQLLTGLISETAGKKTAKSPPSERAGKPRRSREKTLADSDLARKMLLTGLMPDRDGVQNANRPDTAILPPPPARRKNIFSARVRRPGKTHLLKTRAEKRPPASFSRLRKQLISGLYTPAMPVPEKSAAATAAVKTALLSAQPPKRKETTARGLITGSTGSLVPGPDLARRLSTGSIAADYRDTRSRYLQDGGPMNLAEVVAKTILENPEIGIARARTEDSKHAIGVARAALYPKIDISIAAGSEDTYLVTKNSKNVLRQEASVTIRQNLFDFGKTFSDIARARALLSSSKFHLVDKTDEIVLTVASAYIDVLEARRFVGISRQNVAAHKKLFKLVKANEEGGNATAADTKRVASRQESAKANLIDMESKLQAAKEEFRKITRLYPGRLAPPPDLDHKTFSANPAEIEAKLAENPVLLAVQEDILSLRRQLSTARRGRLPKLTFEGYGNSKKNISGRNNRAHDFRGMIKLSYSLFDGGARQHGIMQIKARIQENEMRYEKLRNELLQEYRNSAQTASASASKAGSIRARLSASAKVRRLYIEQFKAGKRTVFELLDAQTDYFNARSEQIANTNQRLRTQYKKLRLNGKLVQTILGYSKR